jgi:ubiquinone/menaquinone biosynthesis C-methylase UbiE
VHDGASTFDASADAYTRYMGLWSRPLAAAFAAAAGINAGMRAIDVGCGSGELTRELMRRLGAEAVAAVEPSEPFARACAQALPEADVRVGAAERLPFEDDSFDAALSQLVVNFMTDAHAGVREMRRVTRPGGTVAACTWDYADGMTMLRVFWDAALAADPKAPDEGRTMAYCTPESLLQLWEAAGLEDVRSSELVVERSYATFEDFWEPFTLGVGPGGAYCASLGSKERCALRLECFRRLGEPSGAFTLTARAWFVRGSA